MYDRSIARFFHPSISVPRPANCGQLFDRFCEACEHAQVDEIDRLAEGLDTATGAAFSFGLCLAVRGKNLKVVRCLLGKKTKVISDALRLNRTIEIFELFRELTSWSVNDRYEGLGCHGGTILP
jgi:hypothetical protein